jgi:hypothetical protein
MGGERLRLLLLAQRAGDLARTAEGIVELSEPLDEARAAAEQLGELVGGQLAGRA